MSTSASRAGVEEALTSDGMRRRAERLGEAVRREDGVTAAVKLIESVRR